VFYLAVFLLRFFLNAKQRIEVGKRRFKALISATGGCVLGCARAADQA
jgi:hypothetical protein